MASSSPWSEVHFWELGARASVACRVEHCGVPRLVAACRDRLVTLGCEWGKLSLLEVPLAGVPEGAEIVALDAFSVVPHDAQQHDQQQQQQEQQQRRGGGGSSADEPRTTLAVAFARQSSAGRNASRLERLGAGGSLWPERPAQSPPLTPSAAQASAPPASEEEGRSLVSFYCSGAAQDELADASDLRNVCQAVHQSVPVAATPMRIGHTVVGGALRVLISGDDARVRVLRQRRVSAADEEGAEPGAGDEADEHASRRDARRRDRRKGKGRDDGGAGAGAGAGLVGSGGGDEDDDDENFELAQERAFPKSKLDTFAVVEGEDGEEEAAAHDDQSWPRKTSDASGSASRDDTDSRDDTSGGGTASSASRGSGDLPSSSGTSSSDSSSSGSSSYSSPSSSSSQGSSSSAPDELSGASGSSADADSDDEDWPKSRLKKRTMFSWSSADSSVAPPAEAALLEPESAGAVALALGDLRSPVLSFDACGEPRGRWASVLAAGAEDGTLRVVADAAAGSCATGTLRFNGPLPCVKVLASAAGTDCVDVIVGGSLGFAAAVRCKEAQSASASSANAGGGGGGGSGSNPRATSAGLDVGTPRLLPGSDMHDSVLCCLAADVDWDGREEVVIGTYGQQLLLYAREEEGEALRSDPLHGQGAGSAPRFRKVWAQPFAYPISAVHCGDFNLDGADEVVVNTLGGMHVLQPDVFRAAERVLLNVEALSQLRRLAAAGGDEGAPDAASVS